MREKTKFHCNKLNVIAGSRENMNVWSEALNGKRLSRGLLVVYKTEGIFILYFFH